MSSAKMATSVRISQDRLGFDVFGTHDNPSSHPFAEYYP